MSYPASFAQRRLWFIQQLEPSHTFYNLRVALRLRGALDQAALGRALTALVGRHESLRTTFADTDGELVQVIAPPAEFPLPVMALESGDSAELNRILTEESSRPFDLARGPLFRGLLLRLGPTDHALLLVFHHILSDGWSISVLYRELSALYVAESTGQPAALEPLRLQYRHYAAWQRERLQGAVLDEELRYWGNQLAGAPPLLTLPADRPRLAVKSSQGSHQSIHLSPELSDAVRALGRAEGATLFMTLLGGFAVLLARCSGQSEVVVGTPIAGRTHTELERLIGFFVNTLPLRLSLKGSPSFRTLLRQVREVALGAYAHQELPFERMVEGLHPPRSFQHHPIYQVVFALQNTPRSPLQIPGIEVERVPGGSDNAKFDLTLYVNDDGPELQAYAVYDTHLFDAATLARMLEQYRAILDQVTRWPDRPVDELELMSERERHQLLVEWNDTEATLPEQQSIPELFEAQARRTPQATALVFDGGSISYAELNRRADRLARRLAHAGVGLDGRVGVLLERSPELVVALLAVLKAGGAYVPLTPDVPGPRGQRMLRDADARVLITTRDMAAGFGPFDGALIDVEEDLEAGPTREERPRPGRDNLAYVMYTSGSTGTPKGVAVTHKNVMRLVCEARFASLGADEVFLLFAPVAFDASTLEIWGPLLNGARLVVAPPGLPRVDELGEVIRRHGVTTLWLTTALFNLMVDERCRDLAQVRQLLTGGEVASPEHVARVQRELPGCRLINGYGPTETTTFATTAILDGASTEGTRLPIGGPIQNTRVYVLDPALRLQPIGVVGELYIGGAGVARGYHREPALTAERFLPDPFAGEPGTRMYRTGDLVRWRVDGQLEFLGRVDNQVKIRGFRVEPGEVQSHLAAHPDLREAAVAARPTDGGGHELIAYVVRAPDTAVSAEDLRRFLRGSLPGHMVPSAFVWLDRLPLNANGKIDLAVLATMPTSSGNGTGPDRTTRDESQPGAAPPSEPDRQRATELALGTIWSALLKVDRIERDDDFFELGGHSLLAVKLFARMERAFGLRLPVGTLFRSPTLAALADEIDQAARLSQSETRALVPLQPLGSRPPLFLIHNIWGDLLEYRPLTMRLGTDQPVFGFEAPVAKEGASEVPTMEEIAHSYIEELRRFQPEGPYLLCGYCGAGALALEMARQLRAGGAPVPMLAIIDGASPGHGTPRSAVGRLVLSMKRLRKRVVRNLRLLPGLSPVDVPEFMRDRAYKILVRAFGMPAYRLSVRLRRPLLPELRQRHGVLSYATRAYQPGRYDGPITLIRSAPYGSPTLGWERFAGGGVDVRWVAGYHLSMMREPFVGQLADQLRACVDQALAQGDAAATQAAAQAPA